MKTKAGQLHYSPGEPTLSAFSDSVDAFTRGEKSLLAYFDACVANIERFESSVQAFVHLDLASARAAAEASAARYAAGKPLSHIDGMPVAVKDIIDTADMPTQMNSPLFTGHRPQFDAASVAALRAAGAVILGKSVTTEFAAGRSGPTRNPYDHARTPGGSSSGSAAGVAAGMIPAALGTQTQSSIVRPSSYCGVFGWKPSHGQLPMEGIAPLSWTLDHLGTIAQHPQDAWSVAQVIGGVQGGATAPEARAPSRLVTLQMAGWPETCDATRAIYANALAALRARGIQIVDRGEPAVEALELQLVQAAEDAFKIFVWESRTSFQAYAARGVHLLGERIQGLMTVARGMTSADHQAALDRRARLIDSARQLARKADGFVSLASSGPAPVGLESTGSRLFAVGWTVVGGPSCSVPVLAQDGLPLGMQLMGAPLEDSTLFAHACWLCSQTLIDAETNS